MAPSVTYLGHQVDKDGIHPLTEKVQAVQKVPEPKNVTELKAYLGLLSYYWRFMPNLAHMKAPLYHLLLPPHLAMDIPRAKYLWGFQGAFCNTTSASLLWSTTPIGPGLQCITLWLQYCVDSLLLWWLWETSSLCVTYSFSAREELLSNQEGGTGLCLKHFHLYLYCWNFTLASDHNPLLSLFGAKKPVPPQALGQI